LIRLNEKGFVMGDNRIHLGSKLYLPEDAVTQTFGIMGRKGSGKTYTAGVLAEGMLGLGAQVVVLDPVGNWFGLRLNRAGTGPSKFKLPIIGGLHADVPLEPTAGEVVASFLVDTGSSAILDVSAMKKAERVRFVTAFAEALFHRKKSKRSAMHLVIEEAQVFAPQRSHGDTHKMLGAMEDMVRLGRNLGMGVTMVSQRPQSVNKEILNQAEPLICMQLTGTHERKAIKEWMEHAGEGIGDAFRELPDLKVGEAWVWSPGWLRIMRKICVAKKKTFDASSTPKFGDVAREPGELAPVDLDALKTAMHESVESANRNNPKLLRQQIHDLKIQLENQKPQQVDTAAIVQQAQERAEKRIESAERRLRSEYSSIVDGLRSISGSVEALVNRANDFGVSIDRDGLVSPPSVSGDQKPMTTVTAAGDGNATTFPAKGNSIRGRVLYALAWWRVLGIERPTQIQVASVAGYRASGGYFSNTIGSMKSAGLIEAQSPGTLSLTAAGAREAPEIPAAPTEQELLDSIISTLHRDKAKKIKTDILHALFRVHRCSMSKQSLADAIGKSADGGYFTNAVSSLKSMGVVEYPEPGEVCLAHELFDRF
jgi:hypothetical protein